MQFDMDDAVGYIIETTEQALKRGLRQRFREADVDITPYQWVILYRLWEREGRNQSELAEVSLKDRATVTRILDVMEKRGLIVRKTDKSDRRTYKVYLTPRAKKLKQTLPTVAASYLEEFTRGIDPEELAVAKRVLTKIRENALDQIGAGTEAVDRSA
jgi:DNA-binding MarR family transcriptional regulator